MRFTHIIAAAAIALALPAAPAFAETFASGHIDASFTYLDTEVVGFEDEAEAYAVRGAAAFPLTERFGAQIDAAYTYTDVEPDSVDTVVGTGHIYFRDERFLLGGFAGVGSLDDDTVYGGGVEGDVYVGDWTFGGQATYLTVDDTDADVFGVNGHVRYFYTDNFMIEGGAGLGNVDGGGADADFYNVGLNAEYRFAGFPGSVFGGVEYTDVDDIDASATAVRIGFRWAFGEESLIARDRTGASLGSVTDVISSIASL